MGYPLLTIIENILDDEQSSHSERSFESLPKMVMARRRAGTRSVKVETGNVTAWRQDCAFGRNWASIITAQIWANDPLFVFRLSGREQSGPPILFISIKMAALWHDSL